MVVSTKICEYFNRIDFEGIKGKKRIKYDRGRKNTQIQSRFSKIAFAN